MSTTTVDSRSGLLGLSPTAAAIACCAVSTLGYSAANVFMRKLSLPEMHCDAMWAMCNKEAVATVTAGVYVLAQSLRGRPVLPKGRPLILLLLMGLATQLGGNAPMQWAYGVAGLAVMIPAQFTFMLTAAAIFGWSLLGERVSGRTIIAICLLLVSVALLGVGAGGGLPLTSEPSADSSGNGMLLLLAVGVACLAGIIYALLSISIRHCVTGSTQLTAVVLIIPAMGVVSLGPLSVARLGVEPLLATPAGHYGWMLAAGVCNLIAFVALTRGLQLISVVHVNVLNAAQVALSAVAGIVLFGERGNPWLVAGILLTIVGIFTIGRPVSEEAVDQHV